MAARWALCNASAASTEADSTAPEAWRISIGSTWRATPCTPRDASARALRGSHRGPSGRGAITSRPASLGASLHVLPVAAEHVQFSLVVAGGAFGFLQLADERSGGPPHPAEPVAVGDRCRPLPVVGVGPQQGLVCSACMISSSSKCP